MKQNTLINNSVDAATSPFHSGEKELQARAGMREQIEDFGSRVILPYMPQQHREFFAQLPFIVVGSIDDAGQPWASIISGQPGFLSTPDSNSLHIATKVSEQAPLHHALKENAPLGLLGIELGTRRRNRMNGRVSKVADSVFVVKVDQSFGNCPQYIQTRAIDFKTNANERLASNVAEPITSLDDHAVNIIQTADTLFVASFVPPSDDPNIQGVDVSHRGGKPGFVKIDNNTLTIPDYAGNFHFNTLGNFLLNPKAGIVFTNFETGTVLMLTGSVELLWEDNPEVKAFKGAERAWRFSFESGLRIKESLPFRSTFQEYSPNTLITGDWSETSAALAAEEKRDKWRPFRVSRIEDESAVIRSFYLEPNDNDGLLTFNAGQFLTVRALDGQENPPSRTYTVSSAPEDPHYRISVKREPDGSFSNFLHRFIDVGDEIEAKAPRGEFFIDAAEKRPAVLIAGGVGITPMVSMAKHIANEGLRTRQTRPLTILHSAQTTDQRAFARELRKLEQDSNSRTRYYSFVSNPKSNEKMGIDFDGKGRITKDTLSQLLVLDDYDFYLCGPSTFMQAMYDALRSLGVADDRVYAEAFGPASLTRQLDEASKSKRSSIEEADAAVIKFTKAKFEQRWNKGDPTILEIAETLGLTPAFGCRNGYCGSCATKLRAGKVSYRGDPTGPRAENEVLICCAVPAKGSDKLEIDL